MVIWATIDIKDGITVGLYSVCMYIYIYTDMHSCACTYIYIQSDIEVPSILRIVGLY